MHNAVQPAPMGLHRFYNLPGGQGFGEIGLQGPGGPRSPVIELFHQGFCLPLGAMEVKHQVKTVAME
jgi:TM2 domain-containing membrane protein YozV